MISATEVQEAGANVVDTVRSAIDVDSVRSAVHDQVDTVRSAIDGQVDTLRSAIDGQVGNLRSVEVLHATDVERLARRRPWTFLAVILGATVAVVVVAKLRAASRAKAQARARLADRQTDLTP